MERVYLFVDASRAELAVWRFIVSISNLTNERSLSGELLQLLSFIFCIIFNNLATPENLLKLKNR